MKNRLRRWTTYFLSVLAICATTSLDSARAKEEGATRPIFVASSAGYNAAWDAVEQIADEMKFSDVVQATRAFYGDAQGVDRSKPFGLVATTDGNELVAFAFLPIADLDKLEFVGVDAFKENIETTDEGMFLRDTKFELLEKDGWLFVFDKSKKDVVLTTNPLDWLGENASESLLTIDVDVAAIPPEFLEAAFAELRRYAAEIQTSDEADLETLNASLEYYSDFVASLERFGATLDVDEAGNLVLDLTFESQDGSPLSETLQGAQNAQTRWGAIAETENAVFASATAGSYSKRDRQFIVNYYRENIFEEMIDVLDGVFDDQKDFETAKAIVAAFESTTLTSLDAETFDFATAFAGEPILYSFAAQIKNADDLREGIQLLTDRIKELEPQKYEKFVALDAETVAGFNVSKIDVPIAEILDDADADDVPPYLADKSLVARLGLKDDAVLLVCGLEAEKVDAEFARIADGSSTKTPAPTKVSFAFAPLGKLVVAVLSDLENVSPEARQTFERIADANDARIEIETKIDENSVSVRYVATAEIFRLVGDVVRVNLAPAVEDDSNEFDELFEDESNDESLE